MIERKKKTCIDCKTPQYIWSHGRCKVCAARHSSKNKRVLSDEHSDAMSELALFDVIWKERPPVSFVSGENLSQYATTYFSSMFHHVLTKKNYPWYRLRKENIILLTPMEHLWIHSLGKDSLLRKNENFQKVFDLYELLREKYIDEYFVHG